jgi:hypothetical protein
MMIWNLARLHEQQHTTYCNVYDAEEDATETIYSDQTRRFPKKLSKGNQYILVLCNVILVAAMINRMSGEMIRAYQELIDHLHNAGIRQK